VTAWLTAINRVQHENVHLWLSINWSQIYLNLGNTTKTEPTVSRSVCLGVKPHLGPKTRFLLLSDSCEFVDVGRPFWREDGSVVYNCCWSSPAQSSSGPSPAGFMTSYFTVSDPRLPQPGGQVPVFISPRNREAQLYPQALGSLFLRLLLLAGLRWRWTSSRPKIEILRQSLLSTPQRIVQMLCVDMWWRATSENRRTLLPHKLFAFTLQTQTNESTKQPTT
jgi:hypothetical protein